MLSPTFRTDPAKYSPSVSPYLSAFYRKAVTSTFSMPETVEIHRNPEVLLTAATTLLDSYIRFYGHSFDSMESEPWYPSATAFVQALVREVGVDRWDDRTHGVMNAPKSAVTSARKARMSLVHTKAPAVSAMQVAISAHIAWDYETLDEVTAALQSLTNMMTS